MNEHDINKKLISNIEMSEDMKNDLISDVKRRKRSSDRKFRYATPLTALCLSAIILIGGASAGAIYMHYKNRVESMDESEKTDYYEDYKNSLYVISDETMTRELTEGEKQRLKELSDKYYNDGVFPESTIPFVELTKDMTDGQLAFVKADGLLHLPDSDLTDEQLLQYIDYQAKYDYIKEEVGDADPYDAKKENEKYVNFNSSANDEDALKAQSKEIVKKFYGNELSDKTAAEVSETADSYNVKLTDSGASYQLTLPKNEDGMFSIARSGSADTEKFTKEQALESEPAGEKIITDFIITHFRLFDVPDTITYTIPEVSDGTSYISYELHYGSEIVNIEWNISSEKIDSLNGKANVLKLSK